MSIDLPNEDVLFAVYAVQLGFATPAQVAEAASDLSGSIADLLERDGAINAQQREAVQRRVEREQRDGCETISESSAPATSGGAPTVDLSGRRGDATLAEPPSIDPGPLDEEVDERMSEAQPGRYTIKGRHASGGQARIMLAIDEHIGREVAIKEFLTNADEDEWSMQTPSSLQRSTPGMVRFLREARVTGQLEHPNIVPVHEVGRREDGTYYYTMRFVRGETLALKLKKCRTLADRMKLLGAFWDVCKAIAFAHSRGVVHRDIKPENVMVGEFGETVLLDWGVAKVAGKRDIRATDIERELRLLQRQDTGKTAAGTTIGTPSYMSPEQARGDIDEIDERSDVWGLGAVLYEILTGRPPYVGETPMDIILKVGEEPLRPVRSICPTAPAELAAVTEKALRKDRDRRYRKASDLIAEIDAWMTGSRVGAYEYSSWELLARFASQNKGTIIAVGLILAVIVGALISVSLSLRAETRARQAEHEALGRAEAARAKEHEERRVANFHLAQAYEEKADRMIEDLRSLSANVFAAASLVHNPAHPGSPFHSPEFEKRLPHSRNLWVEAASRIYRLQFGTTAALQRMLPTDEVLTRVSFSPDARRLAAGSFDNKVYVWDLARKEPDPQTLQGHKDEVYGVAFSPNGRWLASGDRNGKVILHQAASGKVHRILRGHRKTVHQVAFSPDSHLLASACWDGTSRLWNTRTGKIERVLKASADKVNGVAFSPDGRRLATVGSDAMVRVWDVEHGKLLLELAGHGDELYGVAFSPDGKWIASAGNDKNIRLWHSDDGRPGRVLSGHEDGVISLVFSPRGKLLASSSYDKTVRLWNPRSGRALLTIDGHRDFVFGAAFSSDGLTLATSGYDRTARLWSIASGRRLRVFEGHSGSVYALAHSPDGKWLASGSWDRTVRVWNPKNGRTRFVLKGHNDIVDKLAFSPDSTRLASASRDRTARVWNMRTGRVQYVLRGHRDKVYGIEFSPDGELLATASTDKTIRIWEAATGRPVLTIEGHEGSIDNVSFSPDGRMLASVAYDRTVRLWDPRTGEQLKLMSGHRDWISGVDFSPDGKHLATSGKDGVVIIWDARTGLERTRLAGHSQWVNTVTYSPDGKLLATASDDRTVRIWAADSGKLLLNIGTALEVVAVDFSPDGTRLAVGDSQYVKLYPLDFSIMDTDPRRLLQQAERRAGVELDGFDLNVLDGTR